MSNRNNQANKAAARDRLRAERERQAKRDKVRRQLFVGGGVVVVLAVAAGIAVAVNKMNQPGEWDAAKSAKLVQPANTSGKDGTTIVVGDKNNKNNLDVFEDLRCPACAQFEQTSGAEVLKGAKDGRYKITYHFGTFLDNNLKGTGSKNALSAVGASANVGLDAFEQYHTLLYSKAHHPEETVDAFASDGHLIDLARDVPALKGNAAFEKAVKDGTYNRWALDSSDAFNKAGVQSTPTIKLNGKQLQADGIMAQIDKQLGAK